MDRQESADHLSLNSDTGLTTHSYLEYSELLVIIFCSAEQFYCTCDIAVYSLSSL